MVNNFKLMNDYSRGRNISNMEELEKKAEFIYKTTLYSGDKNMYNLWSDSMRGNYTYVNNLIDLFQYDVKFINKVAINYLRINSVDDRFFELCIKMLELIPSNSQFYDTYNNLCENMRFEYISEVCDFKDLNYYQFADLKKKINNKIILDYLAKEEACDWFLSERDYINFDNQSWLYIYDFISHKDVSLASYLSVDQCNNGKLITDIIIDVKNRLDKNNKVKSR